MDIRPDYANVERNGKLEKVDPDEVGIEKYNCRSAWRKSSIRWYCNRGFI